MVLAGPPPAHPARAGVTITVRGLNHLYGSRRGPVPVLRDVDFDVPAGGYAVLTGPSGAGKSTLLSVLGGLEAPQTGSVRVGDDDLFGLAGDQLAAYRRATVGFVFQHFGLLEMLTAAENVELAATLAGMGRPRRRARARELLAAVGLSHRLDHQPLQMSGGERQRVAIARALVNEPRLILADEPTGNLDEGSAATVLDLLESLTSAQGCTLVAVTHN
ncbi:MAG: ABC transporter ATP-binding protein, partial [Acidimicrobiales bacterium]